MKNNEVVTIKKIMIADRLTLFSDPVITKFQDYSSITVFLAIVFFSFQIFCDFSGYSDIARGAAKVMGYDLMINFKFPYHSRSISEFWSRWHISLSTWFRDYVYKPLGGSRVSKMRVFLNILVVFLLSGLWHGAAWTFVAWGALNGFYLIFASVTKPFRERVNAFIGFSKYGQLEKIIDVSLVFTLITLSWIFFRASNLQHAFNLIAKLGDLPADISKFMSSFDAEVLNLPGGVPRTLLCLLLIVFLEVSRIIDVRFDLNNTFKRMPTAFRWSFYFSGVAMIVLLGSFHNNSFIYFQF